MKILKMYSIIFMISSLIISIYESGEERDILKLFVEIIILVPIIIYLILS